jgi:alpha-1,2-mannosyltransferase
MREELVTGAWLTPERMRFYPAMVLILLSVAAALLVLSAKGERDVFGRPLGTDFSEIWIAGVEAGQGHPAQPYDNAAHFAAQKAHFGLDDPYVWPYPPFFLALAAALALLPYLAALALWQLGTLTAFLVCTFGALRPLRLPFAPTLVAALGFPAVFINLAHGQNGFLTAALLAGGLLLVAQRPLLAGMVFALLAYKPHLGLVLPLALIAAGAWRALATASLGVAAMTLATIAAFGIQTWQGFVAGLGFTRTIILEEGALGYEKVQSLFAALRLLGCTLPIAYAAQATLSAGVIAGLLCVWRSEADHRLKAATLIVAALLVTPYVLDYDLVVLAPALAFALSYGLDKGFDPYEKSALALVWAMPLLARPLGGLGLPLGAFVMLGCFAGLVRRALRDAAAARAAPAAMPVR